MSCAACARLAVERVTNNAGDLCAQAYKSGHVSSRRDTDRSLFIRGGGGGGHTLFGLSANTCVMSNFTQVRSLYLVPVHLAV